MVQLSCTFCDGAGKPLQVEWAAYGVLSAQLCIESVDEFPKHAVVLDGSDHLSLPAVEPLTTVRIAEEGGGVVAWGVILDPETQIVAAGPNIVLNLFNITEQTRWQTTSLGWVAKTDLTTIVHRLGGLKNGWSANLIDYASASWSVRYERANMFGALLALAQNTYGHLRQAKDATGAPLRAFELGRFGTPSGWRLVNAEPGEDPTAINDSADTRTIESYGHKREGSKLINIGTPLGGGTGDTQVDLRPLWKILYDPTDPNYGKYGSAPGSVFPEYDANYPLLAIWDAAAGVARPARPAWRLTTADTIGFEIAATLDGRYEYMIMDTTSLLATKAKNSDPQETGEMWGDMTDATFSYVDPSDTGRITVARALYVASTAKLRRYSQVHHSYTVTAVGNGATARAGQTVRLQVRDVRLDEGGPFALEDVDRDLMVMKIVRTYQNGAASDEYTLSDLGRFAEDSNDGKRVADGLRQMEALRIVPTMQSNTGPLGPVYRDVDISHFARVPFIVPETILRFLRLQLGVEALPLRHTVIAAGVIPGNPAGVTGYYSGTTGTVASGPVVDPGGGVNSGNVTSTTENGGTYSGGVVATPGANGTTSNVVGSPIAGGFTGLDVVAAGRGGRTSTLQNSTNSTAGGSGSTGKTNLRHSHTISVSTGGADSPTGTTMHFIPQSGRNSFLTVGWPVAPTSQGTGGSLYTNDWVPAGVTNNADPDHSHSWSDNGRDMTHDHYVSDYHDIKHYHDMRHYHDMQHYHNIAHVHNIDHVHYFPHSHAMQAGIWDDTTTPTFYLYIDGADVSPELGGPWSSSFEVADMLASATVRRVMNTKGKHYIDVYAGGSTGNPSGAGAVCIYGFWSYETGQVATTVFAA
jgi:hypothetical protein